MRKDQVLLLSPKSSNRILAYAQEEQFGSNYLYFR